MDKSELLKLAERVEALSGPDFYVNKSILAALGYTWRGMAYWSADNTHVWPGRTAFTALLDAAMTLVPEGWGFRVESEGDGSRPCSASIYKPADCCNELVINCDYATTPALALCAAALRALAKENS